MKNATPTKDLGFKKTNLELDNQTLKRIEEIPILPADRKNYILSIIDMAIRDFKTQNAYSA